MRRILFSCLIAAIGVLALTQSASAFFLVPFVASALAISELAASVIVTVAAVGASLLANQLLSKSQAPDAAQQASASGTSLSVQYGGALSRNAAMGRNATGGHHVYTNVYGGNNDFLQCVFVVGDGLHGNLTGLWYNGKPVTLTGTIGQANYEVPEFITPSPRPGIPATPHVYIRWFRGFDDQIYDNELVANSNPTGRWTTNHRGRGVCYLSITQLYSEEMNLTGLPSVIIEHEGLVLYDFRKDDTNGGVGPHRWGTNTTYEASNNPAVQEYNFRRGVYALGQRVLGMTMAPNHLLLPMYVAAANSCDEAVPLKEGGTEPRYRCGVVVSDNDQASTALESIRSAMAGYTLERGGQFGPIAGVAQATVSELAFTDDDLIVGQSAQFSKYRSRSEIATAIHGKFSDPGQKWISVAFPAREDPADDAAFGGKIARDIDLTQVFSSSQAQRIAEVERRRGLEAGRGTVTLPMRWIAATPGDWITYTSARHGTLTIEVQGVSIHADHSGVDLAFVGISSHVFSWTTAGELDPPVPGTPPQPGTITLVATGMSAVGISLPGDGGLVRSGISFTWTPIGDPAVDEIDFEIRKLGTLDTDLAGVIPFVSHFPGAGTAVATIGIQAATTYEYRHRLQTTPVRDCPWSSWHTVASGTNHIVPQSLIALALSLQAYEAQLARYVADHLSADVEKIKSLEELIAENTTSSVAGRALDMMSAKENHAAEVAARDAADRALGTVIDQLSQSVDARIGPFESNVTSILFAMTDPAGAFAQLSNRVTAIAGTTGTPTRSVAQIDSDFTAFAGPDGAFGHVQQQIVARFGDQDPWTGPWDSTRHYLAGEESYLAGIGYRAGIPNVNAQPDVSPLIWSRVPNFAGVNNEWRAFADPNGTFATYRGSVTAAMNGHSATFENEATAVADVKGKLAATFMLKLDVNGHIAAIQGYDDGSTLNNITITADRFFVASPSVGGAAKNVFVIDTVNGVADIAFSGSMTADGKINARMIGAGEITAIQIGANQIVTQSANIGNLIVGDIHIAGSAITLHGSFPTTGVSNLKPTGPTVSNIYSNSFPWTMTAGTPYTLVMEGSIGVQGTDKAAAIGIQVFFDGAAVLTLPPIAVPVQSSFVVPYIAQQDRVAGAASGSVNIIVRAILQGTDPGTVAVTGLGASITIYKK